MHQQALDSDRQDIRLTEEEAQALMAIHAKRYEEPAQPTLHGVASALGISDAEALALLTDARAQRGAVGATPPIPQAAYQAPVTPAHRIPSYVWFVAAGVVVFWILIAGMFMVRATRPMGGATEVNVGGFESPTAPAAPETPAAVKASTEAVSVDGTNIDITGKDGRVTRIHSAGDAAADTATYVEKSAGP